jgi:hypothetical protein
MRGRNRETLPTCITVGGQEGDFPADHVLSRDQIFAAIDCLPACERIWEMFESDSPAAA